MGCILAFSVAEAMPSLLTFWSAMLMIIVYIEEMEELQTLTRSTAARSAHARCPSRLADARAGSVTRGPQSEAGAPIPAVAYLPSQLQRRSSHAVSSFMTRVVISLLQE